MPSVVKRWLGAKASEPVKPFLPENQRIYCIGDIHGRLDLLQALHRLIVADSAAYDGSKTIVYLGDYIDRGENSKGVIDLLLQSTLDGFTSIHLMGNHEQTMLDFMQHPRAVAAWLTYGGRAALHSYGVQVRGDPVREALDEIRDNLGRRLPRSHLEFLHGLSLMHIAGSYLFVHAGIRPGVPLQEQRNQDLLWIRDDFTESTVIHEHIVVHGHSITAEVDWRPNRIGIDTGAFQSGILTCLVLEGSEQRLLQTGVVVDCGSSPQ